MVLVLSPELWLLLRDGEAPLKHPDRRAVGGTRATVPDTEGPQGQTRSAVARQPRVPRGNHLGAEVGRALERPAAAVSERCDLLTSPSTVGEEGDLASGVGSAAWCSRRARPTRSAGDIHRRDLQGREK